MFIKQTTSLVALVVLVSLANAQSLTTNVVVTGSTDSLNFNAAVAPSGQFLFNGSKLWMAIVAGQQVYFFSDTLGFVPYPGGLSALLSSNPSEAPSVRTINNSTEVVNLAGWNTRSILGSDAYFGYGSSFADMISAARYKKIYTFVDKAPSVEASQSAFYCNNPFPPLITNYVSFQFLATNTTNYPVSTIYFDVKLSIPGKPFPISQSTSYSIPGGLAPNSSTFLNLQPNMFSDFAESAQPFCGIAASTSLNVRITSAVDGNGKSHSY